MTPNPPILLTESSAVRTDVKMVIALLTLAFALGGGWVTLRSGLADAQTRLSSLESARTKLEAAIAEQNVTNRGVADELAHIRDTTDQTARDVRELQHRKH